MKLSKLAPSQHVSDRWLLHLENGELLRVSTAQVAEFGLHSGMELTEELLLALSAAAREQALREKALRALELRPLSRRELVRKLTAPPRKPADSRKGREAPPPEPVGPEQAEAVADWLEDLGYLDDGEYARQVVRHYCAKGYGERKLRDELYRRGVPRDLWEAALEEAEPPEDAIDILIRKKMQGADPGDPKALKRTSDALARRGYRWDEIREGLSRYGAELED